MANFRVLIVDDAGLIRDLTRKAIRDQFPGWQIAEEINGAKAKSLLKKTSFDLILCDWEMPEMSGSELLEWFRQEQKSTTPFIMVTSRGDKNHVVSAIQKGVSNYLVKPFNNQQLVDKISTTLKKAGVNVEAHRKFKSKEVSGTVSALTGTPTQKKKPQSKASTVTSSSIEALTQSTTAKKATASKSSASKRKKEKAPVGSCELRLSSEAKLKCIIKSASLQDLQLMARYEDNSLPSLLEQAVVDIELAPEKFARINGFIARLEAGSNSISPEHIYIKFHIVDDDGDKLAQLSAFIAAHR